MTARRLLCLIALGLAGVATAAPPSSAAPRHVVKDGGILRMGTTDPFDSMNPFVAFQRDLVRRVHEHLPDAHPVRQELQDRRRLGEVLDDLEGRPDLDVHAQARQVVRRHAGDRR